VKEWLRRNPVAAFLPFQALMYFSSLGRLSPWGDEAYAFETMHLPVPEILRLLAHDVHPPLYYLTLFAWLRVPLGLSWEVQARALSGLFLLAATVAADHWWARRLGERGRLYFLAIWATSPCLLLYGRMCHSFCLQLLLGTAVAGLLLQFAEKRDWRTGTWLAAGLAATLYTHYVPGLALALAANVWLLAKKRVRDAAALDAVVALAYLPWAWWLIRALGEWGTRPPNYFLTGGAWTETPLRLAYWAMSFVLGEAQPDWAMVAGVAVGALAGVVVLMGARREGAVAGLAVLLAATGYIGVARWVAYPFVPARMLFVYPLLVFLLIAGAMAHRRLGAAAISGLLILAMSGIWSYSHQQGFLNQQYVMPLRAMAAEIDAQPAGSSLVLVDTPNSDFIALRYCVGPGRKVLETREPAAAPTVEAALADPAVHTIWFLRSPHDVTPEHLDDRFEARLRAAMQPAVEEFGTFSPLERRAMLAMGMAEPQRTFQELLKFQR
jgi:hypothetical protein